MEQEIGFPSEKISPKQIQHFCEQKNYHRRSPSNKDEKYELKLIAIDALGAYVTKSRKLHAEKSDEPPTITSVSIPGRVPSHGTSTFAASGTDPDGDELFYTIENYNNDT